MATQKNNNRRYKLVVVGDKGVGKTSYINQLFSKSFDDRQSINVGPDVNVYEYDDYEFAVWDCPGLNEINYVKYECFDYQSGYYIGADAAIIMVDINNITNIGTYLEKLSSIGIMNLHNIVFVANKLDKFLNEIPANNNYVTKICDYKAYMTSTKNKINVKEPLEYLISKINNVDGSSFYDGFRKYKY